MQDRGLDLCDPKGSWEQWQALPSNPSNHLCILFLCCFFCSSGVLLADFSSLSVRQFQSGIMDSIEQGSKAWIFTVRTKSQQLWASIARAKINSQTYQNAIKFWKCFANFAPVFRAWIRSWRSEEALGSVETMNIYDENKITTIVNEFCESVNKIQKIQIFYLQYETVFKSVIKFCMWFTNCVPVCRANRTLDRILTIWRGSGVSSWHSSDAGLIKLAADWLARAPALWSSGQKPLRGDNFPGEEGEKD